jgi:ribosomal protein L17
MRSHFFHFSLLVFALSSPISETINSSADEPTAPADVVELLEGADSAEAALKAMVAASNAGDDQAAMLLVDPAIRPLLLPSIAIERYAIDSLFFKTGAFGEDNEFRGGQLFHFTLRDLVRIRSIKQLEKRLVDDKRVVFTVLTTEKSYHKEKHIHNVRSFLAIQRSDRWYLFRPFGELTNLLCGIDPWQDTNEPVKLLQVHQSDDEHSNRKNADYELEYRLPIELIHEHLVEAASAPEIKGANQLASRLQRHYDSIVNRAKRGDYQSRRELKDAMDPIEDWADILSGTTPSLTPGLLQFAKNHGLQPE